MRTAISIPDATFKAADASAQALGISRSEFFTRAAELMIRTSQAESVTARINATLERAGNAGVDDAVSTGRRTTQSDQDHW